MKKTLSKAAGAVSGMTILSRIFGFIRDAFIAMTFGSSTAADAFFVAFRIPNMQRRVLGEGAVSSAFIPVFTEVLAQNIQNILLPREHVLINEKSDEKKILIFFISSWKLK